jgi:hypothetical protein
MKVRRACAIAPVAEPIVYYTVEVALTPAMKAYQVNGYWLADTTMTRSDAYHVAEDLAVGTKACLDKNDWKIRTACAIAPVVAPVVTPTVVPHMNSMKYRVQAEMKRGYRAVLTTTMEWMVETATTANMAIEVAEDLAVGDMAYADYAGGVPMLRKFHDTAATTGVARSQGRAAHVLQVNTRVRIDEKGDLYMDTSGQYIIGETAIAIETYACLDGADMKVRPVGQCAQIVDFPVPTNTTATVVPTPTDTATAKYYVVEAAMPAGSWAWLDNVDGKFKLSAAGASGSF